MLYQVYKSEPFIKVVQRYEGFKDINRLKGLIKENHEGFVLGIYYIIFYFGKI